MIKLTKGVEDLLRFSHPNAFEQPKPKPAVLNEPVPYSIKKVQDETEQAKLDLAETKADNLCWQLLQDMEVEIEEQTEIEIKLKCSITDRKTGARFWAHVHRNRFYKNEEDPLFVQRARIACKRNCLRKIFGNEKTASYIGDF